LLWQECERSVTAKRSCTFAICIVTGVADVQPEQDHPTKRSQSENTGQFVRKFTVA
jgi:hypothetical protein